jgi:YqaJ-like viral recombinase domain
MERWHLVESITKELYSEPIESVGFIRWEGKVWLSPDAIIREGEIIKRAIEIKSPEAKTTIMYFLDDKIPDEYYWQIVQYFLVIDTLESLDFIVSNPDMHDEFFRLKKKTVYRTDFTEDIQKAKEDIVSFYDEIYIPLSQKLISLKK